MKLLDHNEAMQRARALAGFTKDHPEDVYSQIATIGTIFRGQTAGLLRSMKVFELVEFGTTFNIPLAMPPSPRSRADNAIRTHAFRVFYVPGSAALLVDENIVEYSLRALINEHEVLASVG